MLMLLTGVYVLILLYSGAVMIFLTSVFVGVLTLIWSIIMVEFISKVTFEMSSLIEWVGFMSMSDIYRFSNIINI